ITARCAAAGRTVAPARPALPMVLPARRSLGGTRSRRGCGRSSCHSRRGHGRAGRGRAKLLILAPGRHLLVANAAGVYASLADATYTGGFAATGGSIVLRAVGGAPVDSVGWGDATNAFIEGGGAPAPAAGTSIERRPGGPQGNTIDTNNNADDWFAQAVPNPQNVAAPPVPSSVPSPTPTSPPVPTLAPTSTPDVVPTATPTAPPTPDVVPTATPTAP